MGDRGQRPGCERASKCWVIPDKVPAFPRPPSLEPTGFKLGSFHWVLIKSVNRPDTNDSSDRAMSSPQDLETQPSHSLP